MCVQLHKGIHWYTLYGTIHTIELLFSVLKLKQEMDINRKFPRPQYVCIHW